MKIAIITAIWQRYELTEIFLRYYNELRPHIKDELILCCAGSEGDKTRLMAELNGWYYTESPNEPLSDKFNSALRLAKCFNPDAVVLVGSDDFLNAEYFSFWGKFDIRNICGGLYDAYLYDLRTKQLVYFKGYHETVAKEKSWYPVGGGRIFGKTILETLKWKLWDKPINKGLDSNTDNRINRYGFHYNTYSVKKAGCVLGVRSGQNLSLYEKRSVASIPNVPRWFIRNLKVSLLQSLDCVPVKKQPLYKDIIAWLKFNYYLWKKRTL